MADGQISYGAGSPMTQENQTAINSILGLNPDGTPTENGLLASLQSRINTGDPMATQLLNQLVNNPTVLGALRDAQGNLTAAGQTITGALSTANNQVGQSITGIGSSLAPLAQGNQNLAAQTERAITYGAEGNELARQGLAGSNQLTEGTLESVIPYFQQAANTVTGALSPLPGAVDAGNAFTAAGQSTLGQGMGYGMGQLGAATQAMGNYDVDPNAIGQIRAGLVGNRQFSGDELSQYMNPYVSNVVNEIGRLGNENFQQNTLAALNSNFTGAGGFGSSRQMAMAADAAAKAQREISAQQAQAMNTGYNNAAAQYADWANRGIGIETGNVNREMEANKLNVGNQITIAEQNAARQLAKDQFERQQALAAAQAAMTAANAAAQTQNTMGNSVFDRTNQAAQTEISGANALTSGATNAGNIGMQGAQQLGANANVAGTLGTNLAQVGVTGAENINQGIQNASQLGVTGNQAAGQLGIAGGNLGLNAAQGQAGVAAGQAGLATTGNAMVTGWQNAANDLAQQGTQDLLNAAGQVPRGGYQDNINITPPTMRRGGMVKRFAAGGLNRVRGYRFGSLVPMQLRAEDDGPSLRMPLPGEPEEPELYVPDIQSPLRDVAQATMRPARLSDVEAPAPRGSNDLPFGKANNTSPALQQRLQDLYAQRDDLRRKLMSSYDVMLASDYLKDKPETNWHQDLLQGSKDALRYALAGGTNPWGAVASGILGVSDKEEARKLENAKRQQMAGQLGMQRDEAAGKIVGQDIDDVTKLLGKQKDEAATSKAAVTASANQALTIWRTTHNAVISRTSKDDSRVAMMQAFQMAKDEADAAAIGAFAADLTAKGLNPDLYMPQFEQALKMARNQVSGPSQTQTQQQTAPPGQVLLSVDPTKPMPTQEELQAAAADTAQRQATQPAAAQAAPPPGVQSYSPAELKSRTAEMKSYETGNDAFTKQYAEFGDAARQQAAFAGNIMDIAKSSPNLFTPANFIADPVNKALVAVGSGDPQAMQLRDTINANHQFMATALTRMQKGSQSEKELAAALKSAPGMYQTPEGAQTMGAVTKSIALMTLGTQAAIAAAKNTIDNPTKFDAVAAQSYKDYADIPLAIEIVKGGAKVIRSGVEAYNEMINAGKSPAAARAALNKYRVKYQ